MSQQDLLVVVVGGMVGDVVGGEAEKITNKSSGFVGGVMVGGSGRHDACGHLPSCIVQ